MQLKNGGTKRSGYARLCTYVSSQYMSPGSLKPKGAGIAYRLNVECLEEGEHLCRSDSAGQGEMCAYKSVTSTIYKNLYVIQESY